MPFQISRPLIIFIILMVFFLIGRSILVPESFGKYGHYRADSVKDNQDMEMQYTGAQACGECHKELALSYEKGRHGNLSCETCHGPGRKHMAAPQSEKLMAPDAREFCALCHAFNFSRPASFPQIDLSTHWAKDWGKEKCITCHDPHDPRQE